MVWVVWIWQREGRVLVYTQQKARSLRRPPLKVRYCKVAQPPDGSPGPEANTILRQDTLGDDRQARDQGGTGVWGAWTGEIAGVEGFMTPRSQSLPISEMVEGIPGVFTSRLYHFCGGNPHYSTPNCCNARKRLSQGPNAPGCQAACRI